MNYKNIIKKMLYPVLLAVNVNQKVSMNLAKAYDIMQNTSTRPNGKIAAQNQIKPMYDLMIVVAAYNAEQYLHQCIDSVLNQKTKYTYEIVIVDDGSKDTTGKIADSYSSYNRSVRVIHQENRGFSGARNRALEIITGRYLTFLDSDDYLTDGAIEKLLDIAYSHHVDIAEGAFYKFKDHNYSLGVVEHSQIGLVNPIETLTGYTCGKLYKAQLFEKVKFPEGYLYEDTIIGMILYWNTSKAYAINDIVYAYRQNPEGITHTSVTSPKSIDTFWITELCLSEQKIDDDKAQALRKKQFLQQVWTNYNRTRKMSERIREAIFVATVQLYNEYFCDDCSENLIPREMKLEDTLHNSNYGKYLAVMRCWSGL